MSTQWFVPSLRLHITGLIERILATTLQSVIILSSCRVLVNRSNRFAFLGVSNAYQLTEYSLLIFD